MKILNGKKETYSYLEKIRSYNSDKVTSSGNGYFSEEYNLDNYVNKVIEFAKSQGDDFLVSLSSKLDDKSFGGIQVKKNIIDDSLNLISEKEKK